MSTASMYSLGLNSIQRVRLQVGTHTSIALGFLARFYYYLSIFNTLVFLNSG